MSVIFDQVARRYIVTIEPTYIKQMREHQMPAPQERAIAGSWKRRLGNGGREVIAVLQRARPRHPSLREIKAALPQVAISTLYVRLSEMTRRGDILCFGPKGQYCYGVCASTEST